ncbi:1-deoxy-D-xylulose-5-phosphate reductoisomerase [Rhodoferax sp.]|uniref:1-deoxy-D-xylulose-5-phosphate reductoisomerase n=1 Tax=Rhodoferax sp. TaxID=50421 RepID=UPI0037837EB3
MKNLLILGSTGSIGVSTLEVVDLHPDRFAVFALTAATHVERMLAQCAKYQPQFAVMDSLEHSRELAARVKSLGLRTQVLGGAAAIRDMACDSRVDIVMAAIVGAAGLEPCMAAALAGKRLLLANKEALVVGGQLFMDAVAQGGATLLPIDSEHSAIFQSLPQDRQRWPNLVDKLILTASGGPFRRRDPSTLGTVTPQEACAHPNWTMGRKISVDSATMMNKALEVIEAHYLFGMPPEKIDVVIHPQSVVHSMVQYVDHSVVAQLGTPDMKGPIAYGLAWPERVRSGAAAIDFSALSALTFESYQTADHRARYPGLALAWQSLTAAPGTPAVLNASNEVGVAAFLDGRIRFDQIHHVNLETVERAVFAGPSSVVDLVALDQEARALAGAVVKRIAP